MKGNMQLPVGQTQNLFLQAPNVSKQARLVPWRRRDGHLELHLLVRKFLPSIQIYFLGTSALTIGWAGLKIYQRHQEVTDLSDHPPNLLPPW